MILDKKQLDLKDGITREWIITNGLGGYSSSTVLGINTRKYHGLLVAPLTPPAMRTLILSKLDESIEIKGKNYNLYSNMCKNYISDGYKFLEKFEKEYVPIFTYKIENITVTKSICMKHGRNTVCVLYHIENNGVDAKLTITPILNFRDFHTMSTNHEFYVKQEIKDKKVKVEIDENVNNPIYFYMSDGKYIKHENDIFRNMYYIEEDKRGFYPEENHSVPGRYEIEIKENSKKEIGFICSLEENIEEINVKTIINKEIMRLNEKLEETRIYNTKKTIKKVEKDDDKILKYFIAAIDNFIVYRPSFGYHTIISGYPWFLDRGRDALISFEGLLLLTNRHKYAKEVLLTMIRDIKFGLVPNGYSGHDNRPLYDSADTSLLLFEQVSKYLKYTDDYEFVEEKIYPKLKSIIENYADGIDFDDNNIFLDKDGLISSGTENKQNTWMDSKYINICFTPRNGKSVELNSLWYNALKIMENLSKKFGDKKAIQKYEEMAEKCKKCFNQKFYNSKKKCLYDVLGDSKVRPNQLFALSLTNPIVEPDSEIAKNIIETVEKKLLNKYGLKTLAKGEKGYIDIYEGNSFKRDSSYHQGITWVWLLGLYYDALKNMAKAEKNKTVQKELLEKVKDFKEKTKKIFEKELVERGTIGTFAEIYDSKMPNSPKGAIAQAWSVSEIFRIIYEK